MLPEPISFLASLVASEAAASLWGSASGGLSNSQARRQIVKHVVTELGTQLPERYSREAQQLALWMDRQLSGHGSVARPEALRTSVQVREALTRHLAPVLDHVFEVSNGDDVPGAELLTRLDLDLNRLVDLVVDSIDRAIRVVAAQRGGLSEQVRQHDQQEVLRRLDRIEATASDASLQIFDRVSEVEIKQLRIHRAVMNLPYLRRAAKEEQLSRLLREGRPALVIGPSMVGKSRLAFEVVRALFPERRLYSPRSPASLSELQALAPNGAVIWLDDLDRLLDLNNASESLIETLQDQNVVVATMRSRQWMVFQPTNEVRHPAWDAIALLDTVEIDPEEDAPDEASLIAAVPDRKTRNRIQRYGIGEYVGAGELIKLRLKHGKNASPVGHALVLGAADWARTGMTRPVPTELLQDLAEPHLRSSRAHVDLRDPNRYEDALRWATTEINPTVSLLKQVDAGYVLYDYALDQISAAGESIPQESWRIVAGSAHVDELTIIGIVAHVCDQPAIAEDLWRRAADAGELDAMANLGALLNSRGKHEQAEYWFRKAATGGLSEGMRKLGLLQQSQGDLDGADHWLHRAAAGGSVPAVNNLGLLHKERQDFAGAEVYLLLAADQGDTDGAYNLGLLYYEHGHTDEARTWYLKAANAGIPEAMYNLAAMLGPDGAGERWLSEAARCGLPAAMCKLGLVHQMRGELVPAKNWFRQAAKASDPTGMYWLGSILEDEGDTASAEVWYEKAASKGSPEAMNTLGVLLRDRGAVAEAEQWFRSAANAGIVVAKFNLGVRLMIRGELHEAETWFRRAADQDYVPAMRNLGILHIQRDDPVTGVSLLCQAADRDDIISMINLGLLCEQRVRDDTQAEFWYRKAAESGHELATAQLRLFLARHSKLDL